MEIIKCLNGCLVIQENVDVPIFVALFYILPCACLDSIHFYPEYHGVEPKTKAMPLFQVPSTHSSKSGFIALVDLE